MATYDVKDATGKVYTVSDGAPAPQPQAQPSTWGRVQAMAGGADEMLFGAGHAAAALARTIANGKNYGQNWTDIANESGAAENTNPEAYHSGQALGVGLSLPIGGTLGEAANTILDVKALAQGAPLAARVANVGRAVAADAATGASMGTLSGAGNAGTPEGALRGGVTGAVEGAGVGRATSGAVAAANVARNYTPWSRAVQILGNSIKLPGESDKQAADRLAAAYDEYKSVYGHGPSVAELSDEPQMRDVAAVSGRTVAGQRAASDFEANAAATRPIEMNAVIANGGETNSPTALRLQGRKNMDTFMLAHDGDQVPITAENYQDVFGTDATQRLLGGPGDKALRGKLAAMRGKLEFDDDGNMTNQPDDVLGTLDLREVEDLRKAAGTGAGSSDPADARVYKQTRDALRDVGTDAVPGYGPQVEDYMRYHAKAEGMDTATKLGGEREAQAQVEEAGYGGGARPSAVKAGLAPGMRTYLAERANKDPDSAVRLANELTNSAELRAQVRATLPPAEAERVLLAGKLANKATIGLAAATPKQGTIPGEEAQRTGTALRAGMLAVKGGSASFEAHNAIDWLTRLGYPAGTAKYLANLAGSRNPNTVRGVLNELTKRGTTAAQRHAFMNAARSTAAGAVGNLAGAAQ